MAFYDETGLRLGQQDALALPLFITHAVRLSRFKTAVIFPVARLPAAHLWLDRLPLARVYMLNPRPSMPPRELYQRRQ